MRQLWWIKWLSILHLKSKSLWEQIFCWWSDWLLRIWECLLQWYISESQYAQYLERRRDLWAELRARIEEQKEWKRSCKHKLHNWNTKWLL